MTASLERVRTVVDAILEEPPATLLELKRRLAGELAIEPRAEVLQALAALPDLADPQARSVAMRATVLHLLVESALAEVWGRPEAEPAALRRGVEAIPALLELARTEEAELGAAIERVDRLQRDAVARMKAGLKLPEAPLLAALAVVPELERLACAARTGELAAAAPHLIAEEIDVLARSAAPRPAAPRPDRVLVDATALRSAIERALDAWREGDGDGAHLAELRAAHGIVCQRLDDLRARRFEQTRRGDPELDAARKRLFTTYLALSKALAGDAVETAGDLRETILAAEREGAAIDAERAQTANLMKNASDGTTEAARPVDLPPDMSDLVRERKRKKVLSSIALALVPVAVGVNIWLRPRKAPAQLVELQPLNVAVPVSEAMPIGNVLYSQVATFLWDGMSVDERKKRLNDLGNIAGRQGYRSVVVVDDARIERGYWSATGGVLLRPEKDAPQASAAMGLGPVEH